MKTFHVCIVANNAAGNWASWDSKIAAIKAFYAPVCNLEITLSKTTLTPQFSPYEGTTGTGTIYRVNEAWYQTYIAPLGSMADIVVFVVPPSDHPDTPTLIGIETGNTKGVWETTIFCDENDHVYFNQVDQGETAAVLTCHELSHAFYGMISGVNGGPNDNTHKYFYSVNPSGVLQDFKFGDTINELYTQLIKALLSLRDILLTRKTSVTVDMNTQNPDSLLPWGTVFANHHNVRALCDLCGLTYDQKQILTACVMQESNFDINSINHNYAFNAQGVKYVASTDFGIAQWNDYYHGKEITPDEALHNPEKAIRLMCHYWKNGQQGQWVSYSSGAYLKYLGKV